MNDKKDDDLWEELVKDIKKANYSKDKFHKQQDVKEKIVIKSDFNDDFL